MKTPKTHIVLLLLVPFTLGILLIVHPDQSLFDVVSGYVILFLSMLLIGIEVSSLEKGNK